MNEDNEWTIKIWALARRVRAIAILIVVMGELATVAVRGGPHS